MREAHISLARDFSRNPGPRFKRQGPHSGELFRKLLVQALSEYDSVVVDLDGTSGIGSSFLDEAFGGLVRSDNIQLQALKKRLRIISRLDSSYLATVEDALNRAKPSIDGDGPVWASA